MSPVAGREGLLNQSMDIISPGRQVYQDLWQIQRREVDVLLFKTIAGTQPKIELEQ